MAKKVTEPKPAVYTQKEWNDILKYRATGKIPNWGYEKLDLDKTGGKKKGK
jgi:hypothetical protein